MATDEFPFELKVRSVPQDLVVSDVSVIKSGILIQTSCPTNEKLHLKSKQSFVTNLFDPCTNTFRRFVIADSHDYEILSFIPNNFTTRLVAIAKRQGEYVLFSYDLRSRTPWSPMFKMSLPELPLKTLWISENMVAIVTANKLLHRDVRKCLAGETMHFSWEHQCCLKSVSDYEICATGQYAILFAHEREDQENTIALVLDLKSREVICRRSDIRGAKFSCDDENCTIPVIYALAQSEQKWILCTIQLNGGIEGLKATELHITENKLNNPRVIPTDWSLVSRGKRQIKMVANPSHRKYYIINPDEESILCFEVKSDGSSESDSSLPVEIVVGPCEDLFVSEADGHKAVLFKHDKTLWSISCSRPLQSGADSAIGERNPVPLAREGSGVDQSVSNSLRWLPFADYARGNCGYLAALEISFSHQRLAYCFSFGSKEQPIPAYLFKSEMFFNFNDNRNLYKSEFYELPQELEGVIIPRENYDTLTFPDSKMMQEAVPNIDSVKFVMTETVKERIVQVLQMVHRNEPMLIEGDPGTGKSMTVTYCAALCNAPLLRCTLGSQSTVADLLGTLKFSSAGLQIELGVLSEAVKYGYWLMLEDTNLANESVLKVLEDVLNFGVLQVQDGMLAGQPEAICDCIKFRVHPNFRLFICQNSTLSCGSGRAFQSASLLNHFVRMNFNPLPQTEWNEIIKGIVFQESTATKLISLHEKLTNSCLVQSAWTLHDLVQACDLFTKNCDLNAAAQQLFYIYTQWMDNSNEESLPGLRSIVEEQLATVLPPDEHFEKAASDTMAERISRFLDMCRMTQRSGLIAGFHFSGKFEAIKNWADRSKTDIVEYYCNPETTTEDLVGQFVPQASDTRRQPDQTQEVMQAERFRWIDGPLVKAMKQGKGKCLVLRSVNQLEISILEELSSLIDSAKSRRFRVNGELIEVKPEFFVVSTYSRSNTDDAIDLPTAFRSRCACLEINEQVKLRRWTEDLEKIFARKDVSDRIIRHFKQSSSGRINLLLRGIEKIKKSSLLQRLQNKQNLIEQMIQELSDIFFRNHKNRSCPNFQFLFDSFDGDFKDEQQDYTLGESRKHLFILIAICTAMGIPLLLEGNSGVGKTSLVKLVCKKLTKGDFVLHSFNKDTSLSELMGHYLPTDNGVKFVEGSLRRAIRDGSVFIADEFNLATSEVLGYLTPLLSGCKYFHCSATQEKLPVNPKFSLVATQNPPEYLGRKELSEPIVQRLIRVSVLDYGTEETCDIMLAKIKSSQSNMSWLGAKVSNLFSGVDSEAKVREIVSILQNRKLCLRSHLKLINRLITSGCLKSKSWKEGVQLHILILFGEPHSASDTLRCEIKHSKEEWTFVINNEKTKAEVKLPALSSSLPPRLLTSAHLSMCKLAFAIAHREPVVLEGPTCYKSTLVRQLSEMVALTGQHDSLTTLYLSELTEERDLLGGIEPHSADSFCDTVARKAAKQLFSAYKSKELFKTKKEKSFERMDDIRDFFRLLCEKLRCCFQNKELKSLSPNEFLKELFDWTPSPSDDHQLISDAAYAHGILIGLQSSTSSQFFPFCERGIMTNLRFGGICLLRDINLADQAVLERLNSVTDLDPTFLHPHDIAVPLHVHKCFRVVATMSHPLSKDISRSMQSRYTFIKIESQDVSSPEQPLFKQIFEDFKSEESRRKEKKKNHSALSSIFEKLSDAAAKNQTTLNENSSLQIQKILKVPMDEGFSSLDLAIKIVFRKSPSEPSSSVNELHPLSSEFKMSQCRQIYTDGIGVLFPREIQEIQVKDIGVTMTKAALKVLNYLLIAHYAYSNINLVGPPGTGKTKLVQVFAEKVLKKEFIRISCSDDLSQDDLFGTYLPCVKNGKHSFVAELGTVLKAAKSERGCIILFDEVNLAPPEVLSTIIGLLKHPKEKPFELNGREVSLRKVQFVCAMNPASVGGAGAISLHCYPIYSWM